MRESDITKAVSFLKKKIATGWPVDVSNITTMLSIAHSYCFTAQKLLYFLKAKLDDAEIEEALRRAGMAPLSTLLVDATPCC